VFKAPRGLGETEHSPAWARNALAGPWVHLTAAPPTKQDRPLEKPKTMQAIDLAPHLEALKRALGDKLPPDVTEQDLRDEFAKYLEYGVPVDQALKTILRHHGVQSPAGSRPGGSPPVTERLPVAQLPPNSPSVIVKARVLTANTKTVNARGEAKEIVWGLLGDESGSIPYTSWRPLEGIQKGDVLLLEGAYTKEYQGKPQLNLGDRTRITKLDDSELPRAPAEVRDVPLAELREGLRGLRVTARVLSVAPRQVSVQGAAKTVWSGVLADASGQVEFSAWHDHGLKAGEAYTIEGGYVRAFRGQPQYTFDADAKVGPAAAPVPDAAALAVRPPSSIAAVVERGGGSDLTLVATLLEVRPGSGLVLRCSTPGCTRVLTAGQCRIHNRVEGVPDLRIKGVLDDGTGALGMVAGREITEQVLGKTLAQCIEEAKAAFRPEVIQDQLREKAAGRVFQVRGNAMSDEYGPMLIARSMQPHREPKEETAKALLDDLAALGVA
jgi:replication factor A1